MGKKYLETKENSLESSVLGIWQEAAKKEDELAEAKFSPKEIKMAIGVASDKRYAGGNMTGAVKAIEKMKKGLSGHPQVAAVLKRQNENITEKKANFLRLTFNSPADVKKARKWMDQNLPGADQGFTGVDYRAKDIEFEGVDDAEDLMKKLKNARFKFKVDHREENELDVIENTMAKVREFKIQDMKAALAQVWGMKEGKNPFKKEEEEKPVITKGGKTLTGKKPANINVNPKIDKEA